MDIIDNITDCTIDLYDRATRGDLKVLNVSGQKQSQEKLYNAYLKITDEFNTRIGSSQFFYELDNLNSNQFHFVQIERLKLGLRIFDICFENPYFATDELFDIAKNAIESAGVSLRDDNFSKIFQACKAKISYYENIIEMNNMKLENLKDESNGKGSIYDLVAILRMENVTINKDDSLIILADCLNNLRKNRAKK